MIGEYSPVYDTLNITFEKEGEPMHEMTKHYLVCALWASTDNSNEQGGNPLVDNYTIEDFAPAAIEQADRECRAFLSTFSDLIRDNYKQAGYDFWLTRNHHGAGFWDSYRPWTKDNGIILTNAAHAFGELNVVIGDDGKLYLE